MKRSKREEFKKIFLNDSYIRWLSKFMKEKGYIDNLLFVYKNNLSDEDKLMVNYLDELFNELHIYYLENGIGDICDKLYCFKYRDNFYVVKYDSGCYSCEFYDETSLMKQLALNNEHKKYYFTKDFKMFSDIVEYNNLKNKYSFEEQIMAYGDSTMDVKDLIRVILKDDEYDFYTNICYMLSPEERNFIREHLVNKSCINCTNGCCRVESYEKVGYDSFGNPMGSDCFGWDNSKLIGKSKVLKINDIKKM